MRAPSAWPQLVAYALVVTTMSVLVFVFAANGGSFADLIGANVPVSAIAFVCPALAAVIVSVASKTTPELALRLRLPHRAKRYWVVSVVAMPIVVLVGAVVQHTETHASLAVGSLLLSAGLYLLSATGEQIGWMGFVLPRLRLRLGGIRSGLIIGVAWAVLHVIPYVQAGNSWGWVAGQCLFTVCFAIVLTELTLRSEGSIWPAVVAHAAYNLAWTITTADGGDYNPWLTAVLTAILAIGIRFIPVRPDVRQDSRSHGRTPTD